MQGKTKPCRKTPSSSLAIAVLHQLRQRKKYHTPITSNGHLATTCYRKREMLSRIFALITCDNYAQKCNVVVLQVKNFYVFLRVLIYTIFSKTFFLVGLVFQRFLPFVFVFFNIIRQLCSYLHFRHSGLFFANAVVKWEMKGGSKMLLIKCKCGSLYTLKETIAGNNKWINCPGCETRVHIDAGHSIFEIMCTLKHKSIDVQRLPDNAKIEVSFEC